MMEEDNALMKAAKDLEQIGVSFDQFSVRIVFYHP